jgi:predicted nucleic acid-binding protein
MRIERVVVNASPLICLCKSSLSEILPALFTDIIVPAVVHKEITAKEDITQACRPFFSHQHVKIVSDIVIPTSVVSWDLGEGESAVLTHALKHSEYWAVIDDREARKCASTLGCRCTGTVGVILLAKRRGIISSVKECLTKLQNAGLWLSQDFVKEVCLKAGEQ